MWVKICGITTATDALAAIAMGADAVGFVFAPSPRQVTAAHVREITRQLPPEILTVGVFRDESPERVVETVLEAGLQGAQLHGHETPADAQRIRESIGALIVAFPVGSPSISRFGDYHADAVLIDGVTPGSGQVFDWSMTESLPDVPRMILAGGLNPENVRQAVRTVHPWGVDVSTGVERSAGVKDARLVRAFIRAARAAESETGGAEDEAGTDGEPAVSDRSPYDDLVDLVEPDWADNP